MPGGGGPGRGGASGLTRAILGLNILVGGVLIILIL